MIQRIRQLTRAIFGRMDDQAYTFIRCYLTGNELLLFYAMHPADQFHSFRVAVTAKELYQKEHYSSSDEYIFLIRCALLHDIGRVKGTVDVWGKVLGVILSRFIPMIIPFFIFRKDKGGLEGKLGTALYIYFHHPQIGAEKLHMIGKHREAEIVGAHQKKEAPEDGLVLSILKQADSYN